MKMMLALFFALLNAFGLGYSLHLLQIETNGMKGPEWIIVSTMAGAIVSLALYIKKLHKDNSIRIEKAYCESSDKVEAIYLKTVEGYHAQNERTTLAVNNQTLETKANTEVLKELSKLIRETLQHIPLRSNR